MGLAKNARDRFIVAGRIEFALVIATTDMDTKGNARMTVDDCVVHFNTEIDQAIRVAAALAIALAYPWIEQSRVLRRVYLDIRTAQANKLFHFVAREVYDIRQVGSLVGIGSFG